MKLLQAIESDSLSKEEIRNKVAALLANELSARGFMAALGVSEAIEQLQGAALEGLLDGLKAQPEAAYDLLVKNIIMSSAAALSHQEAGDLEQQAHSESVTRRCLFLAQKLANPQLTGKVNEVLAAMKAFEEDPKQKHDSHHRWFQFFQRWGYQGRHLQKAKPHLEGLAGRD